MHNRSHPPRNVRKIFDTTVSIHAWVFMTNHVHLLVTPHAQNGVSKMMQVVGRHYVRYFNHSYRRTGTLWEGRFKSCVVDADDYLLLCQRYIELNPVRAGMVDHPSEYRWSSYASNGLCAASKLRTPHELYQRLGKTVEERALAYRKLFVGQIEEKTLFEIRDSLNRGLALGNDRFKTEIEHLTGRRVSTSKPGPKSRAGNVGKSIETELLL